MYSITTFIRISAAIITYCAKSKIERDHEGCLGGEKSIGSKTSMRQHNTIDKPVKISIKYKGRDQSLKINGWRPFSDKVTSQLHKIRFL